MLLFFVGFVCCGHEYVNSSTSLCCEGVEGYPTLHPAGNATVTLQCCGSTVIHQEEECCNGIGYDPQRLVCADQPTPGLPIEVCVCLCLCPSVLCSTLCVEIVTTEQLSGFGDVPGIVQKNATPKNLVHFCSTPVVIRG